MNWRCFHRARRRFRVTRQKWALAGRRAWQELRERLPALPLRRVALFLTTVIVLVLLVWGYARRPFGNNPPVPLVLRHETNARPPADTGILEETFINRAPAGEEEPSREEKDTAFLQLQEEITELRRKIEDLAKEEKSSPAADKAGMPAFGRPVQGRLLRTTGWYRTGTEWRYHSGVDLSLPAGRNVLAGADGRVSEVRADLFLGQVVVIDHGGGWRSYYGRLREVTVAPGREVQKGTVLGKSSSSTCGPEPGIHFALSYQGNPVDPLSVIPGLGD